MRAIPDKLALKLKSGDTVERCGFLTKRGRVVEVPNVHPEPTKQFRIDPKDTIKWLEIGIVATWHTHPESDPNLSGEDYQCFLGWDDLKHYIVGRRDGEVCVATYHVENGLVVQE